MSDDVLRLRPPRNLPDLLTWDALVRRAKALREEMVLQRDTIAHWNDLHPEDRIDSAFEDSVIAWCDGEGPLPSLDGA